MITTEKSAIGSEKSAIGSEKNGSDSEKSSEKNQAIDLLTTIEVTFFLTFFVLCSTFRNFAVKSIITKI